MSHDSTCRIKPPSYDLLRIVNVAHVAPSSFLSETIVHTMQDKLEFNMFTQRIESCDTTLRIENLLKLKVTIGKLEGLVA